MPQRVAVVGFGEVAAAFAQGRQRQGQAGEQHGAEVRQQVPAQQADAGLAERARGGDKGRLAQDQHLAADDARHGQPFDQA